MRYKKINNSFKNSFFTGVLKNERVVDIKIHYPQTSNPIKKRYTLPFDETWVKL